MQDQEYTTRLNQSYHDSHLDTKTNKAPLQSKRIHDSYKYTSNTESVLADQKLGEISKLDYEVLSDHLIGELS